MSNVKTLNATEFAVQVEASTGLTLVDFYAAWCGPCKMIEPGLESLAGEYASRLQVVKIDADAHPEVLVRYGVRGLPTLILFEDGKPVGTHVGAQPTSALRGFIEEHVVH